MENNKYEPYMIQNGKYKGRFLEDLIFEDFDAIMIWLSYLKEEKAPSNALQERLKLLNQKIPSTKMLCPICKEKSVKYFLLLDSSINLKKLACCESQACQEHLLLNHQGYYFRPIKLSSFLVYTKKSDRKKAVTFLKAVLGFVRKPNANEIFTAFTGETFKSISAEVQLAISF